MPGILRGHGCSCELATEITKGVPVAHERREDPLQTLKPICSFYLDTKPSHFAATTSWLVLVQPRRLSWDLNAVSFA